MRDASYLYNNANIFHLLTAETSITNRSANAVVQNRSVLNRVAESRRKQKLNANNEMQLTI